MTKPLHLHKTYLYCNSDSCRSQDIPKDENGNRLIHKYKETYTGASGDLHCIHCDNWLCGEYDAFGNTGFIHKNEFIPHYLEFLRRHLEEGLPEEHLEGKMLAAATRITIERLKHLELAVDLYP